MRNDHTFQVPSKKLFNARATELLVPSAVIVIGLTLVLWATEGATGALITFAVLAILTAIGALALRRRVRSWGYLEREDDLIVARGLMFRKLTVVPYGRMQFIDVTAGPVERYFGLASVQLHTAAAASDAHIPGLEAEEAGRLRDRLARLGEARSSGL